MTINTDLQTFIGTKKSGIFEEICSIHKKIDNDESINLIYRSLAWLMGMVILKEKQKNNTKKIKVEKLFKKFGFGDKQNAIFNFRLFDHCYAERITYKDGTTAEILISEPYCINQKDFELLSKFCNENGLEFWIGRHAEHYPNETCKLCIQKKKIKEIRENE